MNEAEFVDFVGNLIASIYQMGLTNAEVTAALVNERRETLAAAKRERDEARTALGRVIQERDAALLAFSAAYAESDGDHRSYVERYGAPPMIDRITPEEITRLKALCKAATPGPWEFDTVCNEGAYGMGEDIYEGFSSYQIIAPSSNGHVVICDTLNSDCVCVEEEFDEDGAAAWDEVARKNMAFIAAARTALPALLVENTELRAKAEASIALSGTTDAMRPASDGWLPIESAPSAKAVLIAYTNRSDKWRIVKAVRYERFQSEQEFDEFDTAEYCEAKDAYFIPAGGYELIDNWDDFSSVSIDEGKPTFWRDLPTPPAQEEGK